ncbi:MAG: hypothetical protein RLZZ603_1581, partial [Actinomycetota bacterium]
MYLYPTDDVRIFAHRGLAIAADGTPLDENTIPAFARALEVGADYIESDIQVSLDGVPVLFHDDTLARVSAVNSPVNRLTIEQIRAVILNHGGTIPTLAEALEAFPQARFNLDFKSVSSITAGCKVIIEHGAQARVLAASFNDARGEAAAAKARAQFYQPRTEVGPEIIGGVAKLAEPLVGALPPTMGSLGATAQAASRPALNMLAAEAAPLATRAVAPVR